MPLDLPKTTSKRDDPLVKQFSVFLSNKVGAMLDVVKLLNSHSCHVVAMSVSQSTDSHSYLSAYVHFGVTGRRSEQKSGKARGLTSLRQGYDLVGRAAAELTAAQSYLEKTFTHAVTLLRF